MLEYFFTNLFFRSMYWYDYAILFRCVRYDVFFFASRTHFSTKSRSLVWTALTRFFFIKMWNKKKKKKGVKYTILFLFLFLLTYFTTFIFIVSVNLTTKKTGEKKKQIKKLSRNSTYKAIYGFIYHFSSFPFFYLPFSVPFLFRFFFVDTLSSCKKKKKKKLELFSSFVHGTKMKMLSSNYKKQCGL